MLLTIDIGNTNISFGIFKAGKILKKFSLRTVEYNTQKLRRKIDNAKIDAALICSVVPRCEKILADNLERHFCLKPHILGKDIFVPITNLYQKPKQVGQDRLVNAYAGIMCYGAPLVVVDFGTAITFDVISKNKAYLGGMILPGLEISLDALTKRTALLPKVKLAQPKEFIGRDTKMSMLSGITYGFAALTDCLAGKIKKKLGKETRVIGTGGNINFIARYCAAFDKTDIDLTLKGLNLIYIDAVAHCHSIKRNFY